MQGVRKDSLFLENELAKARSALSDLERQPVEPDSEEYVDLQSELRKALSEIASMQIELGQKDKLQDELIKLKSSMEQMEEMPSRGASPAFVNKLMVELNAAKSEIERLQSDNLNERGDLSDTVISLQDELRRLKKNYRLSVKHLPVVRKKLPSESLILLQRSKI